MPPSGPRVLVLVTGAARSGTSTAAGTLHHLGLDVPGPFMDANESNPKGFYESRWSVRFHNQLIRRAGINAVDGRPDALERVHAVIDDQARAKLGRYLARHEDLPQLVVKDPRSVWTQHLWADAAHAAGREIRYLSMLRHPAEVVSSRTTYYAHYARAAGAEGPREQASLNLMRWINTTLVSERETRGAVRSFVDYADLLQEWRPALSRVGVELGLRYDPPVEVSPHPVDDFIDPGLRRHDASWADVPVPHLLRATAEQVWESCSALVGRGASDPGSEARLDELAEDYRWLVADAALLDQEALYEATRRARSTGVQEGRRLAAEEAVAAGSVPVDELRSRELMRIVGRRLLRRPPPEQEGHRP